MQTKEVTRIERYCSSTVEHAVVTPKTNKNEYKKFQIGFTQWFTHVDVAISSLDVGDCYLDGLRNAGDGSVPGDKEGAGGTRL